MRQTACKRLGEQRYNPDIDPADFTDQIDNRFFPLKPGTVLIYEGNVWYFGENTEANEAPRGIAIAAGAVAEPRGVAVAVRVKGGLQHARAKGKTLCRPRIVVDDSRIAALRAQGTSWRTISRELGVSLDAVYAAAHKRSKNPTRSKIPTD